MADLLERLKAALADRYTIERELGSGGMATVYLAEDVKLHRKVAIKVLRPELAAALGPDRFVQEIDIAAKLTHPHILGLHDCGEADGFLYYVMPHVSGGSLRDRLNQERQLSLDDALRITHEIADGLSHAHSQGVVHRDVKPENIMFEGGHAVITDFGIARALSVAGGDRLTETGVAIGTPAYMSPEQASGEQQIDGRTDIYALGCVLYEMLSGETPYTAPTPHALIAKKLSEPIPRISVVREAVPPAIEAALMKALAKTPADRFQTAEELLPQLVALATPSGDITPTGTMPVDRVAKRRWTMAGGAVGVAAVLIVAVVGLSRLTAPSPITITTSNISAVTSEVGMEWQPALSPDGSQVAFVAQRDGRQSVVIKSTRSTVGGGEVAPTQGVHDAQEFLPAWSPDGESVRFAVCDVSPWPFECPWRETGRLGGSIRTVALPRKAAWPSWSPDGSRVAFIARASDSIFTYSFADSASTLLAVPEVSHTPGWTHSPMWSPDGRRIAYVYGNPWWPTSFNIAPSSIWLAAADGGEPIKVAGEGYMDVSPAWLDDDHLLFVSNRDGLREVYVVEVGATGSRGEPRKVPGVIDAHTISYSVAGRKLAFSKATVRQNVWSYPADSGTVSIADGHHVTSENALIESHDISPDGRWLAYSSDLRGNLSIYKRPIGGGNPTPIANSPMSEFEPRWSPDGTEIAFHEQVGGEVAVMVVPAEGGPPFQVASAPITWLPLWSPSGLELAFRSNRTGQFEAWVVSREAIGGPWSEATQITDFGCQPSDWAPDGSGVLCQADGEIVLASREGEILWRYDPSTAGLELQTVYQKLSRDGSTIYASARHEDGTEGIWAIPVQGGEPSLTVAYDDAEVAAQIWLSVGPDRLYVSVQQTEADIWVADVEVER
jgi:serine/threonine-protein kinase